VGPRQVWRDLCRIGQGIVTLWRHLRSRETIDLALGGFQATSSVVVLGQPCRYVMRIANVSGNTREVKLTLEIRPMIPPDAATEPSSGFAKHYRVMPRHGIEVEFHYDWSTTGVFMADMLASPPDERWVGEIKTNERYIVSARLCDHSGKQLDRLDIHQELKG
jgi:hypothetical protein